MVASGFHFLIPLSCALALRVCIFLASIPSRLRKPLRSEDGGAGGYSDVGDRSLPPLR